MSVPLTGSVCIGDSAERWRGNITISRKVVRAHSMVSFRDGPEVHPGWTGDPDPQSRKTRDDTGFGRNPGGSQHFPSLDSTTASSSHHGAEELGASHDRTPFCNIRH